jgi:hypothetical protein
MAEGSVGSFKDDRTKLKHQGMNVQSLPRICKKKKKKKKKREVEGKAGWPLHVFKKYYRIDSGTSGGSVSQGVTAFESL